MFKAAGRPQIDKQPNIRYESGIFHFTEELHVAPAGNLEEGSVLGYPVKKMIRDVGDTFREVLLVDLLSPSTQVPVTWQGRRCVNIHESIDRYVMTERRSSLSYYFTHMHDTFEYQPTEAEQAFIEKFVIHAYRNRHGVIVNYSVEKYFLDGRQESIRVDAGLKIFIQEQSKLFASHFVELLLQRKNDDYFTLQREFDSISEILSHEERALREQGFLNLALKDTCIAKIDKMLLLVEKINQHDGSKNDKRYIYLEQYRSCLLEMNVSSSVKKESKNESVSFSEKKEKKREKIKNINKCVVDKNEFDLLSYLSTDELSISDEGKSFVILEELRNFKVNENFDYSSREISRFVKKHRKKSIDFFSSKVFLGDVDQVKFVYPFVSEVMQKEVQEIFIKFLDFLEVCNNEALAEHLVKVGGFFYENSEYYRATIFKKNSQRYVELLCGEELSNQSLLWQLYKYKRLQAFRMFLEQGIRPVSQYTQCYWHGIPFSLPSAVIVSSNKPGDLDFIKILHEFGAFEEIESSEVKFYFSLSEELGESGEVLHVKRCSNVTSPFSLAMRCAVVHKDYPLEVVKYFATRVTFQALVSELPDLFNYDDFVTLFLPNAKHPQSSSEKCVFADLAAMMERYHAIDQGGKYSQIFFCQENTVRRRTIEYSLRRVADDFSALSLQEQKAFIQCLIENVIGRMADCNGDARVIVYFAFFIDSLLREPDDEDRFVRITLLFLRAQIVENLGDMESARQAYILTAQMLVFFDNQISKTTYISMMSDMYPRMLSFFSNLKQSKVIYNLAIKFEKDIEQYCKYFNMFTQLTALAPESSEKFILKAGVLLLRAKLVQRTALNAESIRMLTDNSATLYFAQHAFNLGSNVSTGLQNINPGV